MTRQDEDIRADVIKQLQWDSRVDMDDIEVRVENGKVYLSGSVPNYMEKQAAETDARIMPGVLAVDNRITVTDHHEEKGLTDKEIEHHIKSVLSLYPDIQVDDISVTASEHVVTLSGSVDAYWKKLRVEELSFDIRGVKQVINKLSVVPTKTPQDRSVAEEIKAALERIDGVDLSRINVTVEGAKVTLSGSVSDWEEYSAAFSAAKYTHGVIDVNNNLMIGPE